MKALLSLFLLLAFPAFGASISGTFTYPTKFVDGTNLALAQIERMRIEYGSCAGAAFGTKAGEVIVAAPATAFTIPGVAPGVYCLRGYTKTTLAAGGLESGPSNVLSHTVPWPAPEPGTLVTVATTARLFKRYPGQVVGLVELGVPCGVKKLGDWHEIPHSVVTLNRFGQKQSDSATFVAQCG